MTVRRIHLGESNPGPINTTYAIDELRIVRSIFKPGMWVKTRVPEACSYAEWESAHIQPIGYSHCVCGHLPEMGPGWMSRQDTHRMEPGEYQRIFDTDAEFWCAIWTPQRSCEDVGTAAVTAGQAHAIAKGESFFAVAGQFEIDGRRFTGPQLVKASSGPKTIRAITNTYAFTWNR